VAEYNENTDAAVLGSGVTNAATSRSGAARDANNRRVRREGEPGLLAGRICRI
jgi:hypothetical protein